MKSNYVVFFSAVVLLSACSTTGASRKVAAEGKSLAVYAIEDKTDQNDPQTITITGFSPQKSIEYTMQGGAVLDSFKVTSISCTANYSSVRPVKWDTYSMVGYSGQDTPTVECGSIQFLKGSNLNESLPEQLVSPQGGGNQVYYKLVR